MTPNMQRIGILVIAFVMIAGTLGSFALMILSNRNALNINERLAQENQERLEQQQKETAELAALYLPVFSEFKTRPTVFDPAAVGDAVGKVDLREGDGEVITDDSTYRAYYIGWNPSGTTFDSSFDGDTLKPPLPVSPGSLVPGWYDGVEGMKIGGVREITLPAALAYGERGQGEDIPPNTPIKFIVMAIPAGE